MSNVLNESAKKKDTNSLKSVGIMLVERLDMLKFKDLDAFDRRVRTLKPKRFAWIVHDKDVNEKTGKQVSPHVHLMLEFSKAKRLSGVAKGLETKEQFLESMTKRNKRYGVQNGFMYLTHRTNEARSRYQYGLDDVKSNFSYGAYMQQVQLELMSKLKPDDVLEQFGKGEISFIEAKERLMKIGVKAYASRARMLKEINAGLQEVNAEKWRKEMRKNGKHISVIWLFGPAGSAKTTMAKAIATQKDTVNATFITGGSNDMFQDYAGQKHLILDEFRPNQIPYADVLKILDPFNFEMQTLQRYYNHPLIAEEIIVTSPYSPAEFFVKQKNVSITDGFAQLQRRIALTVQVLPDSLNEVEFINNAYVIKSKKPNPYYVAGFKANKLDLNQLLNEVEDEQDDN